MGLWLQCLLNIALRYFAINRTLVVSRSNYQFRNLPSPTTTFSNIHRNKFNNSNNEINLYGTSVTQNLNQLETWSLLLFHVDMTVKETSRPYRLHGSYVILTEHGNSEQAVRDITRQLRKLRHNWEWSPRARFVIIVTHKQERRSTEKVVHEILKELWFIRAVNCVVIIPTAGQDNSLNIYTFFPYYPPGKCPDKIEAYLLNQYSLDYEGNTGFLNERELFPEKIPDDIKGCPIVISTFDLPPMGMRKLSTKALGGQFIYDEGIDVRLVLELGKVANSRVIFLPPPDDGELWGYDIGNGTWTGITGEVQRGLSDMAINSLWSRSHLIREVEDSREHFIDTARWFISCAKPYPRWSSLTRVFKPSLWLGLLMAYLIVGIIIWQVVKIYNSFTTEPIENQAYTSLQKCLLNFWAVILEESASNNPPHVGVIRAVFMVWVLYCYAINTVYQAYLTTFLINPGLLPQITTEDELLSSGIKLGLEDGIINVLSIDIDSKYRDYVNCNDIPGCLHRTATTGDLAVLFSKYMMQYIITVKYLNADAEPIVCDLQEDFSINLFSLCFTKGFALKRHYDKMLIHLLEGGIVNHWWNEILYLALLEVANDFNLPTGEYIALSMEHLQSAFYFLVMGIVSALFFFLLELFFNYNTIIRNKKNKISNINGKKQSVNTESQVKGQTMNGTSWIKMFHTEK